MSKDPSPKADGLRVMREASRGHLQAKAHHYKPTDPVPALDETMDGYHERVMTTRKPTLIPYAGKDRTMAGSGGHVPYSKTPKPPPGKRKRKP